MESKNNDVERIVSKLLSGEAGEWQENLPEGFGIDELKYDVRNFNYELDWQEKRFENMLCIDTGESYPIPVALRQFLDFWQYGERYLPYEAPLHIVEDALFHMRLKLYRAPRGEALKFFKGNLLRFVKTRFLGFGENKESVTYLGTKGKLPFTVHTRNSNLRVLYSPSYLFGTGNVFGYPSSPVSNFIAPGSYIFGAEGIGIAPQWEATRIYHVPNDSKATLMTI